MTVTTIEIFAACFKATKDKDMSIAIVKEIHNEHSARRRRMLEQRITDSLADAIMECNAYHRSTTEPFGRSDGIRLGSRS